jgi:hypothetical protein
MVNIRPMLRFAFDFLDTAGAGPSDSGPSGAGPSGTN